MGAFKSTQPVTPADALPDEDTARQIIAGQFPDVEPRRVTCIAESDFRTFEVDGAWIFRFPKLRDAPAKLRREAALLPALRRALPLDVPVFDYVGRPTEPYPYQFAGYRKIDGISGEELRPGPDCWPALAGQLGRFLSRLHAFPIEEAEEYGVPTEPLDGAPSLLHGVTRFASLVQEAHPDLVGGEPWRYLTGRARLPPAGEPSLVFSHADLKGEHLILSPSAPSIEGIVDWADMCLTDPLLDFTGLMIWLGEPFVRQVLDHYELPADESFLARVCFYSRCFTLRNLGERLNGTSDAPLDLLLTQMRWTFSR
jgi:aminoglycoside phosphotransferase (APT) family kinase protein